MRNATLAPQLEKTMRGPGHHEKRDFFPCIAQRATPSPLSKLHSRLDSLLVTQWTPRHTRRESRGEWSLFLPHKTRPDSPVPALQGLCDPSQIRRIRQEETANEKRKYMWAERQVKKRVDEKCLSSDYVYILSELAKSWANLEGRKGNVTD